MTFFQDLRFTMRSYARTPGFTAIVLLAIAVGIGVNTAVFSVVNAVLLKPLTYPDPETLVRVMSTGDQGPIPVASIPEYNIWQKQSTVFQQVAAYDSGGAGLNLTGGDHPIQVIGAHVTQQYFSLFGAQIAAGRTFTPEEDYPHGGRVAVLSYNLWMKRFGGSYKVVGSTIQVNDEPWLIIGVLGRNFVTETPIDLWIPFQIDLTSREMARHFNVAARLKPSITVSQANAQLALAADEFRRIYGDTSLPPHGRFRTVSLQDSLIGDTRFPLVVLLGAVGFVLLIACANVANLLLGRASVRTRELATRAALGAKHRRIIRLLLTESLTLNFAGGVLGLALGFGGVRLLLSINPGNIPRIGEDGSGVGLDYRVLLFTLGITVLTGIFVGLVPAFFVSRRDIASALKENSDRSGAGLRQNRIRSLLVIGEIALALVLVVGATLLIRTFLKLQEVNPGFTTQNVLSASMSVNANRNQRTAGVTEMITDGRNRLTAIPGVVDAAASYCLPLQGCFGMTFDVLGRSKGNLPFTGVAGFFSTSWSYFSVLKIPLLRGRVFTDRDTSAAAGVVIINQTMAQKYWPQGDPLSDKIQIGAGGPAFDAQPRQIIGIVGNTRDAGVNVDPFPTMYIPIAQMPDGLTAMNSQVQPLWWIVRSQINPNTLRGQIEAVLRDASGGLPLAHVRTMTEVEARDIARQRFNMILLIIFGIAGLLTAATGVYGVMSYSVQQRAHELGVRMVLGAPGSSLCNMVVAQGMALTGVGVILGTGAAFWLTRFLAGFLFGVKAWDPVAFIATPILLTAVSLVAVWIPARRTTRVDPLKALRLE
jgi:putative ABC transport system permease protein